MFQRIIVPTDFSDCAEEAWSMAKRLGAAGGELILAHVLTEVPQFGEGFLNVQSASEIETDLKQKITKAKSINAVTDLMLHADTQRLLNDLPEGVRDEVRDFAKARLVELGWPAKKAA